ncbi:MAG TPA: hypothetical protein VGI14_08040 [Casimicrobiaceae bacterium]|jgi:hypothetical protein
MARRNGAGARSRGFGNPTLEEQNRLRIAQTAARLIVEHGIADWSHAKRKAARQLMLSEREALPDDDEIEAALVEHQALFGGEAQAATLRDQREEALLWMKRLSEFHPLLVGGVAAGWAGAHSDIRIELTTDDEKAVELMLINASIEYRVGPMRSHDAPSELYIDTRRGRVRLTVRDEREARQRRRPDTRLDAAALERVLDEARS